MLAFLPYPRHLFDADVDALFSPCPSPHGCRARPGAARGVLAPSGSMQLTREGDCYVVSAALPGVRPDEISCVEVVGNRTVRLEVTKKRPRAAPAAPKAPAPKAPAPDTTTPSSDADEAVVIEDPASTAATIDSAAAEEPIEAIVVLDQTLALPQPVDTAGITCTYQNGLLRIQVPIVAPALGDDHRGRRNESCRARAAAQGAADQGTRGPAGAALGQDRRTSRVPDPPPRPRHRMSSDPRQASALA